MEKIVIITVTYNPVIPDLQENIRSYSAQVPLVVVVDNSTSGEIQQQVKNLQEVFSNLEVITLGENKGIAEAQNIGYLFAVSRGFEYFIEIDQDSTLTGGYVANVYATFRGLKERGGKVAAVGGVAINKSTGEVYDGLQKDAGIVEVKKTLSSGMLFEKQSMQEIGLKKAEMFIDLVDWEWCWRARDKGYRIYIDTHSSIIHSMGEKHRKFLFLRLGVPVPLRHYYAFRNSLFLFKKKYVPFKWKLTTAGLLSFKLVAYPFVFDRGFERFRYMVLGIKHFLNKKAGRLNE